MKRTVISLCLLAFVGPFGCTSAKDTPPDPLATREGFCQAWAERACTQAVLDDCNVPKLQACESRQSDFCLHLIPESYSSAHAQECLDAVGDAYDDGDLTAEELGIVLQLAAPCDRLSSGTKSDGEKCRTNDECDTAGGFTCISKAGATTGTCGKPEEAKAGEPCDGPNQVCADGYFCTGEYCVVYKKTGGSCDGDYMCQPTDFCATQSTADSSSTCQARTELSGACTADADCQSHYCAKAAGADEGKCASKLRLSLNEPLCDNLR